MDFSIFVILWDYISNNNFIGGLILGLLVPLIIWIISILFRPSLRLFFDRPNTLTTLNAENLPPQFNPVIYVHLTVENKSKKEAFGCKIYLIKMEQKINGKFQKVSDYHTPQVLKWANENEDIGFDGLEILGKSNKRVDLIHIPSNQPNFGLFIKSGARGIRNGFEHGEYIFHLKLIGSNIKPIKKKFFISWSGEWNTESIKVEEISFFLSLKQKIKKLLGKFTFNPKTIH